MKCNWGLLMYRRERYRECSDENDVVFLTIIRMN